MILETKRLVLREFELNDAMSIFELNTDPEVIRYTGDPPFKSVEESREFLVNYSDYKNNGYGRWAVLLKPEMQFIGWCGFKYHEEGYTDIGFRFFKKYWNNGYATEATTSCLDYGFNKLNLTEIIGRVAKENTPSIRVLKKLNMKFWKYGECHGMENVLYYRVLRGDIK